MYSTSYILVGTVMIMEWTVVMTGMSVLTVIAVMIVMTEVNGGDVRVRSRNDRDGTIRMTSWQCLLAM